ncbi:DUF6428 family protein [Aquimarina hainanensis]|uniref:DUF6428 family protein n=1 Tax=Aquimarina hainanensis TaxID=1578017 RepID=A0ABW5N8P7_9FLAO
MNTSEFISILTEHPHSQLIFEYTPGQFVGTNYHITEVKHISIESVDCGAGTSSWKETVIQLWESPKEIGKKEYMKTQKAIEILAKVGQIKPYQMDAPLKIEYGNNTFHTSQLHIESYESTKEDLIIKLSLDQTDCKAKETCGVPAKETFQQETACSPGSGCC